MSHLPEQGSRGSSRTGPRTIEQQKTFEHLAGTVSLRGWKDFEVWLDADELTIEKHGGRAVCTVSQLPDEFTFHAHFAFATLSEGAYSFTIGEEPAPGPVSKRFRDVDEAARWLLESLERAV